MSKNRKQNTVDFDIGIQAIIPSTQEAYHADSFSGLVRIKEKTNLVNFKDAFLRRIDENIKDTEQFPTDNEVFVFIVQYFEASKEYARRDIDNMAKTILDVLRGRFYHDDSQVKTLLVGKKCVDNRISKNFAYIAIKELLGKHDVDALKISGIERSVTLFQELKSKGVL